MRDTVGDIENGAMIFLFLGFMTLGVVVLFVGVSAIESLFSGKNPDGKGILQGVKDSVINPQPDLSDPLTRTLFTSGALNDGEYNDGTGHLGDIWDWFTGIFTGGQSATAETNAQGAQEVGLINLDGPPPVTEDGLANYFNGPMQG